MCGLQLRGHTRVARMSRSRIPPRSAVLGWVCVLALGVSSPAFGQLADEGDALPLARLPIALEDPGAVASEGDRFAALEAEVAALKAAAQKTKDVEAKK